MTMHYVTYVFIPEDSNVIDAVADALRPFAHDLEVAPWKHYPPEDEIAAMAKYYNLHRSELQKLSQHMEKWNGVTGGVDEKGLYALVTWNPQMRWDWYEIGGRWEGKLRDNVMGAATLRQSARLQHLLPHDFLTPDGVWHEQESFQSRGWLKGQFVSKSKRCWLQEFSQSLTAYPDSRVVCVDRHE